MENNNPNGFSNNTAALEEEIRSYVRKRNICLAVGISIVVVCFIGLMVVIASYYKEFLGLSSSSGNAVDADSILEKTMLMELLIVIFSLGDSAGIAVAVAGGVVNQCKANNRRKLLRRKDISNNYGGNGIEY